MIPIIGPITSVRRRLRQPDAENSNFTNDDIIEYFNDAVPEFADELGFYRTSVEIVGDGTAKYQLPDDCLRVESIFQNGYQVPFVTSESAQIMNDSDGANVGPYGYAIRGSYLYVLPGLPANEVRLVFYVGVPPLIENDEDNIDIPRNLILPLVFRVAADCFNELKDYEQADRHYALFNDKMRRRRKQEADRQNPKVASLGIPRRRY